MSRAKVTQIDKTAKQLVSNIIKVIYKQQSILPNLLTVLFFFSYDSFIPYENFYVNQHNHQ